jgi:hypothetical protein
MEQHIYITLLNANLTQEERQKAFNKGVLLELKSELKRLQYFKSRIKNGKDVTLAAFEDKYCIAFYFDGVAFVGKLSLERCNELIELCKMQIKRLK